MELIHCIYCSSAVDKNLTTEALEEILEKSRKNNEASEITGILLFESGAFFQVLEGDKHKIEQLYNKIKLDERHENVTKLIIEPIEKRAFGKWSMGYPRISKEDLKNIEGLNDFFSSGNTFMQLEKGRAKKLLKSFQQGKWHFTETS